MEQTQTIQGPYKKRKRKNPLHKKVSHRHAYFVLLYVMTAVAILFWACVKVAEGEISPVPLVLTQKPQSTTSTPNKPVESKSSPTRTIIATVYNYQAVPEQTDSTPCVGAMAGIDFCNPPFPIVANNGLKLGTKVVIRGVTYTVADRMNSRYGVNIFDILTKTEQPTLRNEPVEIPS